MPGVSTELESFSSSASHQTGVSASTELQGKHVRNGWITGDQPLRKCLVVFGMFSGLPTGIRIKSLRHLITLYHFSMTCFVTANFILVLYWLAKHITISNITEPGMFRNLIVTIWRAQVTGCDWVIFVLCHTEAGYNSYYSHIQTMTEDNKSGTRIPDSGQIYRHLQRVVVAIGTLLTIFQKALSINSYMHMEKGSWTPENIFTAVVLVIMQIHWAFQTAFIVSILMTNWQMFAAFNSKLECDASDNPGNVRQNLHKYRRSHRRLSELVKKANSCLRHLIAITLGIAMVIELMTLFLIVHGSNLSTGTIVAAWFYALTIGCGVFALVLFAAKVSDATHGVYDSLLTLYDSDDEELGNKAGNTMNQFMDWQLFMRRMDKPEHISAAELFTVNKDLGITILSLIVTYYFVLSQFAPQSSNHSLQNTTNRC